MRTLPKTFLQFFVAGLALLSAGAVLAWTGPLSAPPACTSGNPGCDAPLNVSGNAQAKTGGLLLNTGGATNALIIPSGNVGIGTVSPQTLLSVNGVSNTNPFEVVGSWTGVSAAHQTATFTSYGDVARFLGRRANGTPSSPTAINSGDTLGNLIFRGYDSSGFQIYNDAQVQAVANQNFTSTAHGTSLNFQTTADNTLNATVKMTITGSGNVGIGTASPGQKLDVAGNVQASAFLYSSDERLKKNIAAIASDQALADVLALRPVTYNWVDPAQPTATQIGFVAQQVEGVVPGLVNTNASGFKAIDYARVAPLLVGAAQAQEQKIEALQQEVAALRAELDALRGAR